MWKLVTFLKSSVAREIQLWGQFEGAKRLQMNFLLYFVCYHHTISLLCHGELVTIRKNLVRARMERAHTRISRHGARAASAVTTVTSS